MYLLGKRADMLDADDIKRLVQNKVPENKTLDYKKELNLSQDKDKKEFLFDITSLSNTDGGCLIYGIEESKDDKGQNTGTPDRIVGIPIDNYDKLAQRIEDIVKGNTEPSISNIVLNPLIIDEQNILVIGVSKSLGLPIMVTMNETNKFYRRRNSGKYSVDVYELNQMFLQNQVLRENAEKFRLQRIEKVRGLKVFPNIENSESLFIHIIPFNFLNEQMLDLSNAENMDIITTMKPMYSSGWDFMFNLDGFSTFATSPDKLKIISYDQLIRNGVYETYTSKLVDNRESNGKTYRVIYGNAFILDILKKISSGLSVLKKFRIDPPFIISISINGVVGASIFSDGGYIFSRPFLVDEINLPPIVLPLFDTDIYKQLKPIFDIFWQSVSIPQSPQFSGSR